MKPSFIAVIVLLAVSAAQAQAPFYQGKTIRIVTGYPAGDVNDLWPRLIARHMGKYIPGNPSHRSEYARRQRHDSGQLRLRRCQA